MRLQHQILSWIPPAGVSLDQAMTGRLYQQALLLYYYTCLAEFTEDTQSTYVEIISAATQKGLSLAHVSAHSRRAPRYYALLATCCTGIMHPK